MNHARPSARAIYHAWRALRRYPQAGRDQPIEIRLGEYLLHGPNWEELSFLFNEVFIRNEYFIQLPMQNPYIIDCGANIGLTTVYFKLHYPGAHILAFEPNPFCIDVYERNIAGNGFQDVRLVRAGCSREAGQRVLHIVPGFSPMSSLHADRCDRGSEPRNVELVRLSDHLDRQVDVLKMDIEGAEWDVLADLIDSGKIAYVNRMFIEYHHRMGTTEAGLGQFLRMLESQGYTYSIRADVALLGRFTGAFQDVMLYAVKRELT